MKPSNLLETLPPEVFDIMSKTSDQEIRAEVLDVLAEAGRISYRAMVCGQMLAEKQAAMAHPGNGKFTDWIAKTIPEITERTAYRWMDLAKRALKSIDLPPIDVPVSVLLCTPTEKLSEEHQQAKQLFLDFTADKTIADCMRETMDGDEPHRLTRAVNGRTKGGHRGEDRKAWDIFIKVKLKDITSHLGHWKSFKGGQAEAVEKHFAAALEKWPTPVLESLSALVKTELKGRMK